MTVVSGVRPSGPEFRWNNSNGEDHLRRDRKASWHEYEVSNTWAELLIIPAGLIAGVVAPGHRDRLLALFAELGYECEADPEEATQET